MLNICPVNLIVPSVPEATPKNLFSTELIIAFVLGEEKKAKPKPSKIKPRIIYDKFELLFIIIKIVSPTAVKAIPVEATNLGSILSDIRPARGENVAMIIG